MMAANYEAPIDLTDAIVKLSRAREHLQSLRNSLESYARSEPHTFWLKDGPNEHDYIICAKLQQPIPIEFRIIVGELVHSARSALDHIVYAASDLDIDDRFRVNLQFPIYDTVNGYADAVPRRLRGVSDSALAIVERYQPYNRLGMPRDGVLSALAKLNNIDKHQLIPVVYGISLVQLGGASGDLAECNFEIVCDGEITERGTEVAKFHAVANKTMNVQLNFPTTIKFDQGIPGVGGQAVLRVAFRIINIVEEVVACFVALNQDTPPDRTEV